MRALATLLLVIATAAPARADGPEPADGGGGRSPVAPRATDSPVSPGATDEPAPPPARDAAASLRDGQLLPSVIAARVGDARVVGLFIGGWDGVPTRGATFSGTVEGLLFNRVALRAGWEYLGATGHGWSAGLRLGLLRQERHGIDLAVTGGYRSIGLLEPNGDVEVGVLVSRRWVRWAMFANAIYAQGFDRATRHGEVRGAITYAITDRLHVGLDGRGRFDIASVVPLDSPLGPEVDLDLLAGPIVAWALGPLALVAQAGGHVLAYELLPPRAGFLGLAGVGASF